MSDVAVSDLKGGHAPAQKVLHLNSRTFSRTLIQVGGMRVVTKPRVSESEKPAEKPKEEVKFSLISSLLASRMVAGVKMLLAQSFILGPSPTCML